MHRMVLGQIQFSNLDRDRNLIISRPACQGEPSLGRFQKPDEGDAGLAVPVADRVDYLGLAVR